MYKGPDPAGKMEIPGITVSIGTATMMIHHNESIRSRQNGIAGDE